MPEDFGFQRTNNKSVHINRNKKANSQQRGYINMKWNTERKKWSIQKSKRISISTEDLALNFTRSLIPLDVFLVTIWLWPQSEKKQLTDIKWDLNFSPIRISTTTTIPTRGKKACTQREREQHNKNISEYNGMVYLLQFMKPCYTLMYTLLYYVLTNVL